MRHALVLRRAANHLFTPFPQGLKAVYVISITLSRCTDALKVCVQQPTSHIVDVPIACSEVSFTKRCQQARDQVFTEYTIKNGQTLRARNGGRDHGGVQNAR
jgi:hypothetical protein